MASVKKATVASSRPTLAARFPSYISRSKLMGIDGDTTAFVGDYTSSTRSFGAGGGEAFDEYSRESIPSIVHGFNFIEIFQVVCYH